MRQALGYPFYEYDEQQVPLELDPAYGEEFTRKYNLKMAKLAYDIAGLIKKIEAAPAATSAASLEAPLRQRPNLQSTLLNAVSIVGARVRPWSPSCGCMGILCFQTFNCRKRKRNIIAAVKGFPGAL